MSHVVYVKLQRNGVTSDMKMNEGQNWPLDSEKHCEELCVTLRFQVYLAPWVPVSPGFGPNRFSIKITGLF